MRRFEQLGIQCKRLAVSSGFHTPLFSSFVAPFRQFLDKVAFRAPALPVQCNLTGEAYPSGGDFADAMRDALARHMISPVEFISNVESMYRNGARLFIEIGPGSTLCSFVDSILGDRPHWTFPTNLPRRSASVQLLHALAFCAAKGLDVDPEKVLPRPGPKTGWSPPGRHRRVQRRRRSTRQSARRRCSGKRFPVRTTVWSGTMSASAAIS